jgi:hypothetical protein
MTRPALTRNPTSLAGAVLTTLSAAGFLVFVALEMFGLLASPYSGLIGYVLVPAIFLAGLLLVPVGMWREARRRRRGTAPWAWPAVDFNRPRTRAITAAIIFLTIVNVSLIALASVGVVHYTESDAFCGQVCHTPMTPEFTAHQFSPHANVACVQCHVGPGAGGFVTAKKNGTRQLYLVATGHYSRPIPEPGDRLPGVTGTCAGCHTAGRPNRDITRTIASYGDDETSTESPTQLTMLMAANHWHARADVSVEYVATDPTRQEIPYVRATNAQGQVTEYFAEGVAERPAGVLRRMDCVDCHNRPAHTFAVSAERAVDAAIADGRMSRALPFARREVVAAVSKAYPTEDAAVAGIDRDLRASWSAIAASRTADVAGAVTAAQTLYRQNVFPSMKVGWGTYPTNLGHTETPGCFRCHDGSHVAKSGALVRPDCELCHKVQ